MKRLATGIALVALLAMVPLTAEVASASPTNNSTTITLVCDKDTGSTATLTLRSSVDAESLGVVEIRCGLNSQLGLTRNRTSIPTGAVSAGYVTISDWTVTTSAVHCPAAGPITYKGSCAPDGSSSAALVVR